MNSIIRNILFLVFGILTISLTIPQVSLARDITIVGELNDQDELVSSEDGTVYEIADGEIGDKLVFEHRGEKMRVTGKLINAVTAVRLTFLETL